jgi:hypothetical protein
MKQTFTDYNDNDLVCDYKLSLALMLNDLFHPLCQTAISILTLTMGNPVHLISIKGRRRVWPVSGGCLFLRGTWSDLRICRGTELLYTQFCICPLDYDYVLYIVRFAILYSKKQVKFLPSSGLQKSMSLFGYPNHGIQITDT